MKNELKQLRLAGKVVLAILWPTSAWAASISFDTELANIPMASFLATVVLSSVLGAAALLHWMIDAYEKHDPNPIPRLGLHIASRMVSSNAAGLLVFLIIESMNIPRGYKAVAISLAAFGGTWTIQRLLQFVANKYVPEKAQ